MIDLSKKWQVVEMTAAEFLLEMAAIGTYQDINLVGAYADPNDQAVRTAHRDIDLPFHRDGIFTQSIADLQGGMYVEKPNVDVVGMYCLRDNTDAEGKHVPCETVLAYDEEGKWSLATVDLMPGEALIWDNRLWHGRRGPVGNRVLIRFWTTCPEVRERELIERRERA